MKLTFSLGFLLYSAIFTAAGFVGKSSTLTYADGYLYCRYKTETGICDYDLGDFPRTRSFRLGLYFDGDPNLVDQSYLMEPTDGTATRYNRYNKVVLAINTTPGAFAPVTFADLDHPNINETTRYWFVPYAHLQWTPTRSYADGSPIGHPGSVAGSGWQLVQVKDYPGLFQQYWNQTLFDAMRAGISDGGNLEYFVEYEMTRVVVTDMDYP